MNGNARLTPQAGCGKAWLDLLQTGEKLLCAGLRRRIGPSGDLRSAYRQWYAEQMRDHDQLLIKSAQRLQAAQAGSANAA